MIKHIVMWKFMDAEGKSASQHALDVKSRLEALHQQLKFIKKLEVHLNEGDSGRNFDAVLITEFDSFEDLNLYQNHPDHKAISAFVSTVRTDRACVDYTI